MLRIGSFSAQGVRPNNEDRFVVDEGQRLFMVADGMGGQERGEVASGMAAEIIPQAVKESLANEEAADAALRRAMAQANSAIVDAGRGQPEGRRMGTTAVCALHKGDNVYVASLGDSRAYLIRDDAVEQLTVDHSVAQALVASGALTPEEARHSPYQHVLHKFLGCANMAEGAEVKPISVHAGDRLLLASDGLTNHITEQDLRTGVLKYADPQEWAEHLVKTALERGSRDNVTCIVVAFESAA
ncbi:MAG: protein phosphatase 2C domain-containing protein [Gemmataceae bacterium]